MTASHVGYGLGNFSEQVEFVFYGCASKVAVSRCDIFQAGNHARAHFIPCACHFLRSWGGTKRLRRMSSTKSENSSHLHLARPQQPQTSTNIRILYISNDMIDNAWREISWVMKYVAKPVSNTGTTMRMKGLCRVGVSANKGFTTRDYTSRCTATTHLQQADTLQLKSCRGVISGTCTICA